MKAAPRDTQYRAGRFLFRGGTGVYYLYMSVRNIFLGVILLLLLGTLFVSLFVRPSVPDGGSQVPSDNDDTTVIDDDSNGVRTVFRSSVGNSHTYTGIVSLPTPCHALTEEILMAESYPEQVTVNFIVVPPPADTICAQVVTERRFEVSFSAAPGHTIRFTLNREPLPFVIEERNARDNDEDTTPQIVP